MSDYGQVDRSKFCIPEDKEAEDMDYTSQKDYNSNGSYIENDRKENGAVCTQSQSRKRRPISVIGGVAEQKDDAESLSSVRHCALLFIHFVNFKSFLAASILRMQCAFQDRFPKDFSRVCSSEIAG